MAYHSRLAQGAPYPLRLVTRVVPRLDDCSGEINVLDDDEPTSPLPKTVSGTSTPVARPPVTSPEEVAVGTVLRSRYVLEEIIGQGGDSMVFRATDLHRASSDIAADGAVAIKLLRPERRFDPGALRRLQRQFRQMQRLAHPGIAPVFDLDRDGDIWFISMEWVAGQTINAWIKDSARLDAGLKLIGLCCQALEHAHSRGIVHGDLKPSNVLVAQDGSVKLIDFGSAAGAEPRSEIEREPDAAATASYASPQVLAGSAAEARDDIFSLACLSYVILSKGKRPVAGQSPLDPAFVADIPARLYAVVLRGLAAERELRPKSAREFFQELTGADPIPIADRVEARLSAPRPAPPMPLAQSGSSNRLPAGPRTLLALAVMAVGTLLWAWQAMQHRSKPPQPRMPAIPAKILTPVSTAVPTVSVPSIAPPPVATKDLPRPAVITDASGTTYASGTVSFASSVINVTEAQSLIAIPIKRLYSTRGSASVAWIIVGGTARSEVDYAALDQGVVRLVEGQTVRSIFIPLMRRDGKATPGRPRTLTVALKPVPGGPALGTVKRVTVTIWPSSVKP